MGLFDRRKKKMDLVKDLLFPKTEFKIDSDGEKFAVLKTIDANLNAALQDLKDGRNDESVQATIQYCMVVCSRIREIMNEEVSFENDTRYILVDYDEEIMRGK